MRIVIQAIAERTIIIPLTGRERITRPDFKLYYFLGQAGKRERGPRWFGTVPQLPHEPSTIKKGDLGIKQLNISNKKLLNT